MLIITHPNYPIAFIISNNISKISASLHHAAYHCVQNVSKYMLNNINKNIYYQKFNHIMILSSKSIQKYNQILNY